MRYRNFVGVLAMMKPGANMSTLRCGRPASRRLRFEPLENRRMLAVDFGDAPDPYPTTLADDGPRHEAIGPTLGVLRDEEVDGQPSTGANGDGADEDGVTFGGIRVGQLDASVTVHAQNAAPQLARHPPTRSDVS